MESLSELLQNFEMPEFEYTLTPEEELQHIEYAVKNKKEHQLWVFKNKGYSLQRIENLMATIDFESLIDKKEVLRQANNRKHWHEEDEARRLEKIRINNELIIKKQAEWNYAKACNFIRKTSELKYDRPFIFNELSESQQKYIRAICYFITKDSRFETEFNYSFKKGIMVRGNTGIGKTFLIKCLCDNEYNPIDMYSLIKISHEIKKSETGDYTIPKTNKIIYIDDIGTGAQTINHFGSKINWFQEFIELSSYENSNYSNLIISTNCSFKEIEEYYGFRVRSRCAEMFNVIDVEGVDMRKI